MVLDFPVMQDVLRGTFCLQPANEKLRLRMINTCSVLTVRSPVEDS